ncbi:universal stress protein [Methanocella arvoryzae]|uniref:universal stress protein n=1 Tax=Methanocella arvoryzae TaxID=1175445 RepID=UPI000326D2F8|nr:universal stress protein [Methanocella arvoryzae]
MIEDDKTEESRISGTILLATDGSLPALAATIQAVELARARKAKLSVLNVREQGPVTGIEKMAENSALRRKPEVDGMEFARRLAGSQSVAAEFLTRDGPVVGEIIRTAADIKADMIIMGASDPRGISGLLLGNVAEAVVKQAHCSVVVIKPTEAEIQTALDILNGAGHKVPAIDISDITGSARFKVGLVLFGLYIAGYSAFTITGSFAKGLFSQGLLGLNVALVSGMVLIAAAILMAIGYSWYAGRMESETGGV